MVTELAPKSAELANSDPDPAPSFPARLLEWAGHRQGGVRRLFDADSGRPAGAVIETPLLRRLRDWAAKHASKDPGVPNVVLLVGGPGNGKTDAIEETIRGLELALETHGRLEAYLRSKFNPDDGTVVPRRVDVRVQELLVAGREMAITIVQDASVNDGLQPDRRGPALLCDELEEACASGKGHIFLACINRGVLDEASVIAAETGRTATRELLTAVAQAVAVSPDARPCWPLAGIENVAVWPMDVESLLVDPDDAADSQSSAARVLSAATAASDWPVKGDCEAGARCPFCRSRSVLGTPVYGAALLRMLRWYELASGKRWSFRDLYSLLSYLLAGAPPADKTGGRYPCRWAASLAKLADAAGSQTDRAKVLAPFQLAAAEFQHALFGSWPREAGTTLRADLRDLKLVDDPALLGLQFFLMTPKTTSVPPTLRAQLDDVCDLLDPGGADPDAEIALSSATTVELRDVDARFSRSVREGMQFLKKYHCLSVNEVDLLERLADAEDRVGCCAQRARKPLAAMRVQRLLRSFSCTLARRTVGARAGVVRDCATLGHFEQVVRGDPTLVHQTVKQVDALLNDGHYFHVSLNTTFGEPVPPERRKVVLRALRQKVQRVPPVAASRPRADAQFLVFGPPERKQHIPLTYALFRSVRELRDGMLPSSLPREVVAALDAARARLAGHVVRDPEQLDEAEIRIGVRNEYIVYELGKFQIVRGE